jgi:hypothetical protein
MSWKIDPRLAPFVLIAEVERGDRFVRPLFARKLGGTPPEFGHHLVAFHARGDGGYAVAAYLHLWKQGTLGYVGGGCTDGDVIRSMSPQERAQVADAGGLLLQMLGFCFAKFEPELEAFFGHCGDDRAKEVDLRAGFRETRVPYLLVRPNRVLTPERAEELLLQAQAVGAF